jgi:hypothetical protein
VPFTANHQAYNTDFGCDAKRVFLVAAVHAGQLAGHGHERPATVSVNDQGGQGTAMNCSRIDTCSKRKHSRPLHEGIVAKNDVAETALITVCPEWITSRFMPLNQESTGVGADKPRAQYLAKAATVLALQLKRFVQTAWKRKHVSGNTAMNGKNVMRVQPKKRYSAFKKGDIFRGELSIQGRQFAVSSFLLRRNRGADSQIDTIARMQIFMIALDENDFEGCLILHLADHAHNAGSIGTLVHQITQKDDPVAGIGSKLFNKRSQSFTHAMNIANEDVPVCHGLTGIKRRVSFQYLA